MNTVHIEEHNNMSAYEIFFSLTAEQRSALTLALRNAFILTSLGQTQTRLIQNT